MRKACLLLALSASSCGTPAAAYVAADQATYNAVAPEFRAYVLADPELDQAARDRRLRTLATWQQRIAAAGGVR